jgi:hypothetical protein
VYTLAAFINKKLKPVALADDPLCIIYRRREVDRPLICRTEHLIICMHLNSLACDDGGPHKPQAQFNTHPNTFIWEFVFAQLG